MHALTRTLPPSTPCRPRSIVPQLGLQPKETAFNSFNGPDGPLTLHEDFQFSW